VFRRRQTSSSSLEGKHKTFTHGSCMWRRVIFQLPIFRINNNLESILFVRLVHISHKVIMSHSCDICTLVKVMLLSLTPGRTTFQIFIKLLNSIDCLHNPMFLHILYKIDALLLLQNTLRRRPLSLQFLPHDSSLPIHIN
jgi:hypothetical protein